MDRDLMLLWVIIVGDKLVSCGEKKRVANYQCCSGWFSPFFYVQPFSSQRCPSYLHVLNAVMLITSESRVYPAYSQGIWDKSMGKKISSCVLN